MTMSTSVQTTAFGGPRTTIMSNIASPKPYDTGAHSTPDLETYDCLPCGTPPTRGAVSGVAVVL
jgi:hypothetical protein